MERAETPPPPFSTIPPQVTLSPTSSTDISGLREQIIGKLHQQALFPCCFPFSLVTSPDRGEYPYPIDPAQTLHHRLLLLLAAYCLLLPTFHFPLPAHHLLLTTYHFQLTTANTHTPNSQRNNAMANRLPSQEDRRPIHSHDPRERRDQSLARRTLPHQQIRRRGQSHGDRPDRGHGFRSGRIAQHVGRRVA